jgi:hypothetical protein
VEEQHDKRCDRTELVLGYLKTSYNKGMTHSGGGRQQQPPLFLSFIWIYLKQKLQPKGVSAGKSISVINSI